MPREFSTALRADLQESTQLAIAVAFAKESVAARRLSTTLRRMSDSRARRVLRPWRKRIECSRVCSTASSRRLSYPSSRLGIANFKTWSVPFGQILRCLSWLCAVIWRSRYCSAGIEPELQLADGCSSQVRRISRFACASAFGGGRTKQRSVAMCRETSFSFDPRPLWPTSERGMFPWRIRFISLGLLGLGIPTREVLAPLRMAAPARWFHGFIQQSHALSDADVEALREGFEAALRRQQTDGIR
jgi:hypothetical protein